MAAMLMAGLDGVKRGLDPRTLGFGPFDQNLFRTATEAELREKIRPLPRSLSGALDALQADHAFLLEGGVFTEDIIQGWIDAKRDTEVLEIQQRPHPYEIELYFNV
jgi:glutamine synthetase